MGAPSRKRSAVRAYDSADGGVTKPLSRAVVKILGIPARHDCDARLDNDRGVAAALHGCFAHHREGFGEPGRG